MIQQNSFLRWQNPALLALPVADALLRWIETAIQAVDPAAATLQALQRQQRTLACAEQHWTLAPADRVFIFSIGKASVPMAWAALQRCGDLAAGGVVITRDAAMDWPPLPPLQVLTAGHPLPDMRSVLAAARLRAWAALVQPQDMALVLLSGGASALLTDPAPGLSLAALQATTDVLLHAGVPIQALNTVRKHCERLKGGQLAALLPCPILTLTVSDVLGNDLAVIGSGPTAPDPTTYADAWAVLEQAHACALVPAAVRAHLQAGIAGQLSETPKPQAALWSQVRQRIIADNAMALDAVQQRACQDGWHVLREQVPLHGEAAVAGRRLGRQLRALATQASRPTLLLAGGETTVTIAEPERARGAGGRNQELALAAAVELHAVPNAALLAIATDGSDGPTPAAGAVATGATVAQAAAHGFDVRQVLAEHTALRCWQALGAALTPGPTFTNVNDIVLGVVWPQEN